MGLFKNQFQNLIEWNERREDILFHMWKNREIKKDSKVIIRPGQDAIFLYNGRVEGIFEEDGEYLVESEIIPFLTTLKSFKFGFKTPLRAEVLFINTKQILIKWGTKQPINIPHPQMPGGIPIRCFGTYSIKISDYDKLIENVAGIKEEFTVDDVKERLNSKFNGALTSAILKEGKDMINLQAYSFEISEKLKETLNRYLQDIGIEIKDISIENFNYPEEVQKMIEKNASYGMVGDMNRYAQISMIDGGSRNQGGGISGAMGNMAQATMGMKMGAQIANQVLNGLNSNEEAPIYNNKVKSYENEESKEKGIMCGNCKATLSEDAKFCHECGSKVEKKTNKFCSECGNPCEGHAKFCLNCGNKLQ